MIKEIAKNRKLKKITMAASVVVMGIGLVTSLSSFEGTGTGVTGGGCINRPDDNNGHCVYATINKHKTYFCKDTSWYEDVDCVKG